MPRSAVIAIAVLGVVALLASSTFALVRSAQLRTAQAQLAALRAELEGGDGSEPSPAASEPPPSSGALDELLGEDGRQALDDLLSEDGGVEDLFGEDGQLLASCIQPEGQPGSADIPDTAATAQIERISALVQRQRALEYDEQPSPAFLDDAAIEERLAEEVREEYSAEDADIDQRTLTALGAVPAGTDLVALQTDLLTSQVAGFYDPDTGELVVRGEAGETSLDPAAQATLAHELEHALADQALELPIDTTEDLADSDGALAALSVIEGDATLTQQRFVVLGMTIREQLGLSTDPDALAAQEQLADVPHYLAESLQFPYLSGLRFVCDRFVAGGWDAVDAVYDDLPASSAEILDPSRYGTPPVDPRDPGALGGAWEQARSTTIGAADLLWLFQAPGDDTGRRLDDARAQALAWTGGELVTWTRDDDTAVGVALTQADDGPLCDAVTTWYERAYPEATDAPTRRDERLVREGADQTAVVVCAGEEVRLGIGPDLRTARALAG
jgi:hypothetical protein